MLSVKKEMYTLNYALVKEISKLSTSSGGNSEKSTL